MILAQPYSLAHHNSQFPWPTPRLYFLLPHFSPWSSFTGSTEAFIAEDYLFLGLQIRVRRLILLDEPAELFMVILQFERFISWESYLRCTSHLDLQEARLQGGVCFVQVC